MERRMDRASCAAVGDRVRAGRGRLRCRGPAERPSLELGRPPRARGLRGERASRRGRRGRSRRGEGAGRDAAAPADAAHGRAARGWRAPRRSLPAARHRDRARAAGGAAPRRLRRSPRRGLDPGRRSREELPRLPGRQRALRRRLRLGGADGGADGLRHRRALGRRQCARRARRSRRRRHLDRLFARRIPRARFCSPGAPARFAASSTSAPRSSRRGRASRGGDPARRPRERATSTARRSRCARPPPRWPPRASRRAS